MRQQKMQVFGKVPTPALLDEAAKVAGVKLGHTNNPANRRSWVGAVSLSPARNRRLGASGKLV